MTKAGARKAAMLLRNLDPTTAGELLQSAEPEMLTEIAVEVAFLEQGDAGGARASHEPIREFFSLLHGQRALPSGEQFAKEMLQHVLGEQESQEVLTQVDQRLKTMDPFRQIRAAEPEAIAEALSGESAQAASVVLSELPARKSAKLIGLLDEGTRALAVACMAGAQEVSASARMRIAGVVQNRLEQVQKDNADGRGAGESRKRLRKVAVLLRGVEVDLRGQLIESLTEQDAEASQTVQNLMVTWEDINVIADRSLQESLMSIDAGKLALALVEADQHTIDRVKSNISERAGAMLDEEVSLLSNPKAPDIQQAREEILTSLRDLNSRGDLQFEEN